MWKLKLYLDTSVWNFLYADDAPEKKEITERFFEQVKAGKYELFTSETVFFEIGKAPKIKRDLLMKTIHEFSPEFLSQTKEVSRLAKSYMENGVLGEKHLYDLLHLAYASVNGIEILVSWNMRHIVRPKTQYLVNQTNQFCRSRNLEIWTPREAIDDE